MEVKEADSPDLYQMNHIDGQHHQSPASDVTDLYSHLDKTTPESTPHQWGGAGIGAGGYSVANTVVGEVPRGTFDPNYAAYYHQQAMLAQQQQQQQHYNYVPHPAFSDHGSPEMGAQRYAGQAGQAPPQFGPAPTSQGHGSHTGHSMSNVSHSSHLQRNQSETTTVVEGKYYHSPRPPLPTQSPPPQSNPSNASSLPAPPSAPKNTSSSRSEQSYDCALAYAQDYSRETPTPDVGAMHGLRLANPDC